MKKSEARQKFLKGEIQLYNDLDNYNVTVLGKHHPFGTFARVVRPGSVEFNSKPFRNPLGVLNVYYPTVNHSKMTDESVSEIDELRKEVAEIKKMLLSTPESAKDIDVTWRKIINTGDGGSIELQHWNLTDPPKDKNLGSGSLTPDGKGGFDFKPHFDEVVKRENFTMPFDEPPFTNLGFGTINLSKPLDIDITNPFPGVSAIFKQCVEEAAKKESEKTKEIPIDFSVPGQIMQNQGMTTVYVITTGQSSISKYGKMFAGVSIFGKEFRSDWICDNFKLYEGEITLTNKTKKP